MSEDITFDKEKLQTLIEAYKKKFQEDWPGEGYKWEAVRHFREHWDIDAKKFDGNFAEMFKEATSKTNNLLSSFKKNPKYMIEKQFGILYPDETQNMFRMLSDHTHSLEQRINEFKSQSKELLKRYKGDDPANATLEDYQDENTISIYLWLMDPEQYYIYKYSALTTFCGLIGCSRMPKHGRGTENVVFCKELLDQVRDLLRADDGYRSMLAELAGGNDMQWNTAVVDLVYFAYKYYGKAWLLAWNRDMWPWNDFAERCKDTKAGKTFVERWSCRNRKPRIGEEVFLIKVGGQTKGLIGHGTVKREPYEKEHYVPAMAAVGKKARYIDVEFDRLIDYEQEPCISQKELEEKCGAQDWSPQGSGIEIKQEVLPVLRALWEEATDHPDDGGGSGKIEREMVRYSRNMILYGPPGTGKTYHSIIYAVAICDGKDIDDVKKEEYGDVLVRYRELKKSRTHRLHNLPSILRL